MNRLSFKRKHFFDYTCVIAIYIYSLQVIFVGVQYQILASMLIFPYFIFQLKHCKIENQGFILLYGYLLITTIFSIFNIFFTNNGIGGTLILVSTLALGLYCIDNIEKIRLHIYIIVWINIFYIWFEIIYLGKMPNEVYEQLGLSRNHGGLLLCLFVGFYCFIRKITKDKVSVVLPLVAMVSAYLLVGRSSLGLLAGIFVISLLANNKKLISIILTIIIVGLIIYFKNDILLLYEASSFAENGMESSRYKIWDSYITHIDLESAIFGLDTSNIPVIRDYGGNPHNSFLNFHRRLGLIPFILFLIITFVSILKYFMMGDNYVVWLIIILFSRIFFDSDCFIGSYDFIIYTIIFYPILKYKSLLTIRYTEVSVFNRVV